MNEEQAVQPVTTGGKRIRRTGLGTGTTSLLMIFTLLCFSTLALLSLATATSDARIKGRGMEATQSLAAAEGEADRLLAEMDAVLAPLQAGHAKGDVTYLIEAGVVLEALGFEQVEDTLAQFVFAVPVNENNILVTTVSLTSPGASERYTLESQLQVSVADWTPQGGELWSGNG